MRSNMHRFLWALAIAGAFLVSCVQGPRVNEALVEQELSRMTLREKVGQLFFLRPEALDTTIHYVSSDELPSFGVQAVNDRMRALASMRKAGAWRVWPRTRPSACRSMRA